MPEMSILRFQEAYGYFKQGLSVKEIAHKMSIAPSTAHTYIGWGKDPRKYYVRIERRNERRKERRKLEKTNRGAIYVKDIKSDLRSCK